MRSGVVKKMTSRFPLYKPPANLEIPPLRNPSLTLKQKVTLESNKVQSKEAPSPPTTKSVINDIFNKLEIENEDEQKKEELAPDWYEVVLIKSG